MPRGRRKTVNYTEQIDALEMSIAAARAELKQMEAALKDAREKKAREEMEKLYQAIQSRNLDVEDVISLLDESKAEEETSPSAYLHAVAD
jgi:predicted  nucleic acid-binding Zn-ribbon protein